MTPPSRVDRRLVAQLYDRSRAARWAIAIDRFAAVLDASLTHRFGGAPPSSLDAGEYLEALHLDDLALATACADGHDGAWEHFVAEYRPLLYRAADAIDPGGGARDLADALYADLYGLKEHGGVRQSLFRYFHGRSRLATWLRAVLAQRHVDRVRVDRRHEPLPDDESDRPQAAVAASPERSRFADVMRAALAAAIGALAPRDRLRLSCYYAQEMTLAAIGKLLGEHEATASRHLTQTRREIREAVEECLRREHRFDEPAIAECFSSVLEDPGALDLSEFLSTSGPLRVAPGARSGQALRRARDDAHSGQARIPERDRSK
jgi:RNA polymerase sigma-70 factor, ECF subfamily